MIPISTLEQITGLSGLTARQLGKSGCHWDAGTNVVSYGVQQLGTQDLSHTVDLGNGHDGVVQEAARGVGGIDLRLPPDRLVNITVSVPESSDVGTIILNLGKAFSAVSDTLPALPK